MATTSTTVIFSNASNTQAKSTLKPISDMLNSLVTAGVLIKTTDTGQVDWTTVLETSTSGTFYEIFKLNDSLNATNPIWMKFVYTTPATNTLNPQCYIQLSMTGTNGTGTLTNPSPLVLYRGLIGNVSLSDTTVRPCYASAGDGYLTLFGDWGNGYNAASQGQFALGIERLRDSNGNIVGDGLTVIGTFNVFTQNQALFSNGAVSHTISNAGIGIITMCCSAITSNIVNLFSAACTISPPIMSRGSSMTAYVQYDGANFLAVAIQPFAGKTYPPMTAVLCGDDNFPTDSSMSLSIYGSAHTYRTGSLACPMVTPGSNNLVTTTTLAPAFFTYPAVASVPIFRYE